MVIATLRQWKQAYGATNILNINEYTWNALTPQHGEQHKPANVTKLTCDGAAEFMGKELTSFLENEGILHRATCRYTPEQNAAENIVKIVTQGLETLLWQSGLPRTYWCRAAEYFCKIYEIVPNSAHRGDFVTPYEALTQKPVPFKQLHQYTFAFGEECFYHERKLRAHTHGCEKSLRASFLGFSRRKEGFTILTMLGAKAIERCWDLFFTGEFPVRVEADKQQMKHFNAQIRHKTHRVLDKFGFPNESMDFKIEKDVGNCGEQT